MATKHEKMQSMIRWCREETKKKDVTMHDVAMFAVGKGWKMPVPANPMDMLAKEFATAAREEMRVDKKTKRSYRVNHCFGDSEQGMLWFDIDDAAPRYKMVKAVGHRRDQMIGDGLQLTLDVEHWNSINPKEEPIKPDMDLTDEIEWRKNAPNEDEKAS
jgi:hypothetical protein